MANRLKSSKSKTPGPEKFKPEKEEQVRVKDLVKDERTHKIAGTLALLVSFFLFIAFASYLFTWKEDQDKVFRGIEVLFPSEEIKTANLLGNIGAYISHQFFYNGFGVASFFFCSLFFVLGVNAIFGKKIFSIWRNVRYVVVGVIFFSIALAFFGRQAQFSWGGAFGNMVSDWLVLMLGKVGATVLLLAGGLAYIIWRFNPVFRLPAKKPQVAAEQNATLTVDEEFLNEEGEDASEEEGEVAEKPKRRNRLKEGNGISVIPPKTEAPVNDSLTDFKMVEKDEMSSESENAAQTFEPDQPIVMETPVETPKKTSKSSKTTELPQLELEIKTNEEVSADEVKEEEAEDEKDKAWKGKEAEELPPYEPTLDLRDYKFPSLDLLEYHGSERIVQDPAELEKNKNQIIETLKNYDIEIQRIMATVGPTVTLYEIVPAAGVRISRIKNLEDDIALSLAALGIRIIAPIPGKGTIGIEVPNVKKTLVSMRTLLSSEKFQNNNYSLPIALGKKIDNENFIVDLTTMPHLLMAGATGQGKSVGLNAILVSLLYKKHPSQLKLVLVDPKKVELSLYRTIEKHFLAKLPGEEEAIITDTRKVIHTLNALCIEMDNRYDLLKEAGARNIREYNEKFIKRRLNPQKGHQYLPFIVLVIDEFADLIMTAGKEVEMPIARLAQLARAVGIHLIIATQRPSVNIITGTIKANFPVRIAFKVSSKVDSRTILDIGGAEQLIGKGDMLISYSGELTRLQCAFVDTPEVEGICEYIGQQRGYPQAFLLPEYVDEKEMEGKDFDLADRDPLFEDAARLIVQSQMGSTSLLQRRMKLGYNRAGRLMDQLEAAGVVGPSQGSKARDVLIKTEAELEQHMANLG
jgi:S-DNA-T family DNA segregation ATPase FtsK/SpoIIIE